MSLNRAQGCFLGQFTGDALGCLVEFRSSESLHLEYPQGVRRMVAGGRWNTLAGQPTDDSEMALSLTRTLIEQGTYDESAVFSAYESWLDSEPFDCGRTIFAGLMGTPNTDSQANGAMMRISPLGIFGVNHPLEKVEEWARQDATLTHPHPICVQANALFAMAIAHGIKSGDNPRALYDLIAERAQEHSVDSELLDKIRLARHSPPDICDGAKAGWVLLAFHNALWQLLHAPNLEEAIVDTIMRGGDTDTNAAICGALLGAVYGLDALPSQWVESVLNCRPKAGDPDVHNPRPKYFWPIDALELAEQLFSMDAK